MKLTKRRGVTIYAAKSGRKRSLKTYNYIAEVKLIGKPYIVTAFPLLVTQNIIRWEFCAEEQDSEVYDPVSVEVAIRKDATTAEVALLCIQELRGRILDKIEYLERLGEDLLKIRHKEVAASCPEAFIVRANRTEESYDR